MWNYMKLVLLGLVVLVAALAANWGRDLAYQVHAIIVLAVAGGLFVHTLRNMDEAVAAPQTEYMDGVVRYGVIATAFCALCLEVAYRYPRATFGR